MYKYLAEFLGSLFYIYVKLSTENPIAVGAAFALAMIMTSTISGGFLNPAVTIVMASLGKISTEEIIPYALSQVFGGLVALELFERYKF